MFRSRVERSRRWCSVLPIISSSDEENVRGSFQALSGIGSGTGAPVAEHSVGEPVYTKADSVEGEASVPDEAACEAEGG